MHRKKLPFHSITTQLLELRESLRIWLSVEKEKSYGIVNHVISSQTGRNKWTNNRWTQNRKPSQSSWELIIVVTSVDWTFALSPGVACQTGISQAEELTLAGKYAVTMSPHVLSPLYEWKGHWTWWGEIGCQPRMQKMPFLLFLLPTPFPILVWTCTGNSVQDSYVLSFLVFGLAVRQGNWRVFSKSKWVWGRSLLQYFNSLQIKAEIPLERA